MKKNMIILAVVAVAVIYGISTYNGLVKMEESVNTAWSNVENQYQRRLDLIPNLVNTVKGYADHEQETLNQVIEARSKATQTTIDPTNLTPEAMQEYQKVQNQVSGTLGRLLAVAEAYPDLKANQNFLELQSQLEGTENRISVERTRFNDAAQAFNTSIRKFPATLVAGMLGFEKRPYFTAEEGAAKAPTVEF